MSQVEILKKVTAKAVLGSPAEIRKALRDNNGAPLSFDLFGIVTGAAVKETEFGESLGFTGSFRAVNKQTGQVFNGGTAYLPKAAEHVLGAAVLNAPEGSKIEVALTISVVQDDESNTGYQYRVTTHLADEAEDPLALIQSRVYGQAQLPAPEDATQAGDGAGKKNKK